MTEITIEYCVPCGFRERALEVQEAILAGLEREIDSVRLVTGDHGVFSVRVDGKTVYERSEGADDVDEVVRVVRDHI